MRAVWGDRQVMLHLAAAKRVGRVSECADHQAHRVADILSCRQRAHARQLRERQAINIEVAMFFAVRSVEMTVAEWPSGAKLACG